MKTTTAIIVGSDSYCARILEFALNRRRLNVVRANHALGLSGMLTAFRPDLVLIESGMPDLDCAAVVRFLRGRPETEAARVVLYAREGGPVPPALDEQRARCDADGHIVVAREVAVTERHLEPWLPP